MSRMVYPGEQTKNQEISADLVKIADSIVEEVIKSDHDKFSSTFSKEMNDFVGELDEMCPGLLELKNPSIKISQELGKDVEKIVSQTVGACPDSKTIEIQIQELRKSIQSYNETFDNFLAKQLELSETEIKRYIDQINRNQ